VGSKKNPIWRVVVADQRSPRDGRFIETIGHYNPQTEPSTIVIDDDRLQHWLARGAQPTGTVKQLVKAHGKGLAADPRTSTAPLVPAPEPAAATDEEAPATDAEAPVEAASGEEAPVEDAPAADAPVEGAPVEDAPVEEAPVEEAPVEDAPVEDAPVEAAPVEDAPVAEAPVEDAPAGNDAGAQAEEAPADPSAEESDSA
jgi:small subunit ribosomal protein S16